MMLIVNGKAFKKLSTEMVNISVDNFLKALGCKGLVDMVD